MMCFLCSEALPGYFRPDEQQANRCWMVPPKVIMADVIIYSCMQNMRFKKGTARKELAIALPSGVSQECVCSFMKEVGKYRDIRREN